MSIMPNMTIKRKLILIIMLTSTIALLLAGTLNLFHQHTQIRKELIRSISCYAQIIGENCRAAISFEDANDASEMLKSLEAESSIAFACIYTKEGEVLARYRRPDITEDIPAPPCAKESYQFDKHYFKLFKEINSGDEVIGTVYIQLDTSEMKTQLRLEAGIMILLVLVCSLVAYLVSSRLQYVISGPIVDLAEVAKVISEKKDYSIRAVKQNNDEVGSFIDAFNEMLEQIHQRDSDLHEARDKLEERVRERTTELTRANEQLTREITERKQAEEALRTSEAQLSNAMKIAHLGYWEYDVADDQFTFNDHFYDIYHTTAEQVGGYTMKSARYAELFVYPDDKQVVAIEIKKALETPDPQYKRQLEHRVVYATGEIGYISVHFSIVKDKQGRTIKTFGANQDITDLKNIEMALRKGEERFRQVVESAGDWIWEVNVEGLYTYASPIIERVLGYKPEEVVGKKHFYDHFAPDVKEGLKKAALEAFAKRESIKGFVNPNVHKNGSTVIMETSGTPIIDEKGNLCGYRGADKDITGRLQKEKELKKVHEELLSASHRAGMAEVAADVLHNVGNVLNSINVSTTMITEKVTNSEVANLQKVVSIINDHIEDIGMFLTEHSQGKHIPVYLTEVSRLLIDEQAETISRLQVLSDNVQHIKDIVSTQQSYAKVSGVKVITSIAGLVEDAIQINNAGLQRHGTRLIRDFEELPDVEIDKHKVLQILVNLISNAKYASGSSEKEEKTITIRIYKHVEDQCRIVVADNGVGISPDNLTRIFSHGFTTKKHGHGFGLHSSALASREIGGSLTVHSDGVGRGATFTLELPFKPVKVIK